MSLQNVDNSARCLNCGRDLRQFDDGRALCPDCWNDATQSRSNVEHPETPPTPAPQSRIVVRQRRFPVTKSIVGLNVAVYVLMSVTGVSPVEPSIQDLLKWGASFGPLALTSQPWRILTSNYVHIGIVHIALNMWCLWNLGFLAEVIFDRWTYILGYTAFGIAGSIASLWWHPISVGAGASGAIFGLAGALIAALYLGKLPIPKAALKGTLKSLLMFAGYNLAFGAIGHSFIDNSAHIGGLLSGLAIGAVMAPHLTNPEERGRWRILVFGVSAILLVLGAQYVRRVDAPVIRDFWQKAATSTNGPSDNQSAQPGH